MRICIFEDKKFINFLPLVYFRPVFDLRCGATSLLEKASLRFPSAKISLQVRESLAACCKEDHPGQTINQQHVEDTWFINARVIVSDDLAKQVKKNLPASKLFKHGNAVAAMYLDKESLRVMTGLFVDGLLNEQSLTSLPSENISCSLAEYPWNLVHENSEEIKRDFRIIGKKIKRKIQGKIYKGATLLNRKNILIGKGSVVKPGVVLDAEQGPIIIGNNVTIMPNAVLIGPVSIGDGSLIKVGAKIYHGTSIGIQSKIGGEVEGSIIQSYSNKQHDGFLGHSYLGSWVNLGADTNTSDLKNTYGNVRVELNGAQVDTGLQFVGLTMGDHSKTGINVMFDTGTVVGVSCNIYGANLPPKNVPSFVWGQQANFSTYTLDKSIETARRVMARRNIHMTKAYEQLMRDVFSLTQAHRLNSGVS